MCSLWFWRSILPHWVTNFLIEKRLYNLWVPQICIQWLIGTKTAAKQLDSQISGWNNFGDRGPSPAKKNSNTDLKEKKRITNLVAWTFLIFMPPSSIISWSWGRVRSNAIDWVSGKVSKKVTQISQLHKAVRATLIWCWMRLASPKSTGINSGAGTGW